MIAEDYVSYEVAKLLKEKGFNELCRAHYWGSGNISYNKMPNNFNETKRWYSCPTHQMAMKWLREVHKVVISIDAHTANHWDGYIDTFEIDILKNASRMIVPYEIAIHNIYEDAVEAALKYCLKNLI